MTDQTASKARLPTWFETEVLEPMDDFHNPRQASRDQHEEEGPEGFVGGPLAGAAVAAAFGFVLRGHGGGRAGSGAGQGAIFTEVAEPDKP